jgi:hypothetical protein
MKTRRQIIDQTLKNHEGICGGPDAYSPVIEAELIMRLTEDTFLTCEDFDHFDVKCCEAACESDPHYEMIDVILDDDRHAWVCCNLRNVLIRQTEPPPSNDPEAVEKKRLWGEIFDWKADPVADRLHAANMAAESDEEKLYYTLKYAHHTSGRKRGHKILETIVQRALKLPGGRPAKRCNESDPPPSCGLCIQCGGSIYRENFIPGTSFHNCRIVRELRRKDRKSN